MRVHTLIRCCDADVYLAVLRCCSQHATVLCEPATCCELEDMMMMMMLSMRDTIVCQINGPTIAHSRAD